MSRSLVLALGAIVGIWCVSGCATTPTPVTAPAPAEQAPVITVREVDQDQGIHEVTGRTGIVDINSLLTIRVDSTALRQHVAGLVGPTKVAPAVVARLKALQDMAITRLDSIQALNDALQRYTADRSSANFAAVRAALKPLAADALKLIDAAQSDPALQAQLEARVTSLFNAPDAAQRITVAKQYDALLSFAGEVAADARRKLDEEARGQGARIQIGTWLSTRGGVRPVHAAGLDQTEPSTPFVVDRWSLALDEDQKKEIQGYDQLARAANKDGVRGLISTLTTGARETLSLVSDQLRQCATELKATATQLPTSAGAKDLQARAQILDSLATDVSGLAEKYRKPATGTDASAFLVATNADLQTAARDVKTAIALAPQIKASLTALASGLSQAVVSKVDTLRAKLDSCTKTVLNILDQFGTGLAGINHAEQIRALGDSAWSQVLSLDVGAVPASSDVMLLEAGPRSAGDVVLVRVAASRGTDSAPNRQLLDQQQVTLYRVLPHLELSVGLIFADPLGSTAIKRRFQAAPAYSVLYRRGSRRSAARNSFWNVGVGLSVAAVDFDKDDVPELGLGLTTSAFADLLQAGIGYNVFLNRGYWFFGVRLPVATVNIAGNRTPVDPSGEQAGR